MKSSFVLIPLLLGVAFMAAIIGIAATPRIDFETLLIWYVGAFALYGICLSQKQYWRWWLGVGIAARVVLIFFFPNLSDDLYRFFWDGNLILSGINPFGTLPSDIVGSGYPLSPEMQSAYANMNSTQYHTVYPVSLQSLFALATWISGSGIVSFSLCLKCFYLCFEGGSIWLLYQFLKDRARVHDIVLYALNPLVIIELVGNLHGEAVMIFLMLLTYRFLLKGKILASAGLLSLAIATKLVPLLCLPFVARRVQRMPFLVLVLATAVMTTVLFGPVLFQSHLSGFLSSIDLYFRTFEFNASMYYIARWVGYQLEGFNTIASTGPLMAMLAMLSLGLYWVREQRPTLTNFPVAIIAALTIYYLFATTVHPWYLCPLIAFCTLTSYRYPIIWSGMIFLSYSAYQRDPAEEVLWLIAIEYVVLAGWVIMEYLRDRKII